MSERVIWKPGTMPRFDLAWMAIAQTTQSADDRAGGRDDHVSFWIGTVVVTALFSASVTGALVFVFTKMTGGW